MSITKICKVESCILLGAFNKKRGKHYLKLGYCNKHYLRQHRYGDAEMQTVREPRPAIIEGGIAKIPLGLNAKDGYAIVDKEFAYLSKVNFYKGKNGYAARGDRELLHHIIVGKPAKGYVTDHINRNRLDNRLGNLRIVNTKQSIWNTSPQITGKSAYKGVQWSTQRNKWQVAIRVNGKKIHLGTFFDEVEAAKAYDKAAKHYWGEYAYLNFPE